MADIDPINFSDRLYWAISAVNQRHKGAELGRGNVLSWSPRHRKTFVSAYLVIATVLAGLGFTIGLPPVVIGVAAGLGFFAPFFAGLAGVFGPGIPRIHSHFFRLNHRRVNELTEKCRAFDAMAESLPRVLVSVSNANELLQTQLRRRAALEEEIQAYFRDVELIDGIYWLDCNEKLGIDVESYGKTGDMTALVSMIQARKQLSATFPPALHRDFHE